MLAFLFSWHQVSHSFLDFFFPFGLQVHARDSYYSGFRDDSRISIEQKGFAIPQMRRSGRDLRICYNLRSVEPSRSDPELAWSIRQCAVYHSFDLETGRMLWINVKGNDVIRDRIQSEASSTLKDQASSRIQTFQASLSTHLILCDWAGENWRWYLNDLEEKLQEVARGAIAMPVDKLPSPLPPPVLALKSPLARTGSFPLTSPVLVQQAPNSPLSRSSTFTARLFSRTTTLRDEEANEEAQNNCAREASANGLYDSNNFRSILRLVKAIRRRLSSASNATDDKNSSCTELSENPSAAQHEIRQKPDQLPPNLTEDGNEIPQEGFHFGNLQSIQYIEERTQDALMHLRLDIEVLGQLRRFYQDVVTHNDFPEELKASCATEAARFAKIVMSVIKDLEMMQARADTLLALVANRKSLVSSINGIWSKC